MAAVTPPQKITFGEMRSSGARGLLIYCADYHCSHSSAISPNRWPDDVRLSDIEPLFTCQACGRKGADVGRTFIGMGSRSRRWAIVEVFRCAAKDDRAVAAPALMESAKITREERPRRRSAGTTWGRFSGLRGRGRMQIVRCPSICVQAIRPSRCGGFTINHIGDISR